jgi:hypothetical protein
MVSEPPYSQALMMSETSGIALCFASLTPPQPFAAFVTEFLTTRCADVGLVYDHYVQRANYAGAFRSLECNVIASVYQTHMMDIHLSFPGISNSISKCFS